MSEKEESHVWQAHRTTASLSQAKCPISKAILATDRERLENGKLARDDDRQDRRPQMSLAAVNRSVMRSSICRRRQSQPQSQDCLID